MATADGTFSLKQWREVHDFFAKGKVPFTSIEPSALDYDSVQKGRYKQTLNTEKSSLKKYNDKQKANLYRNSKPSLKEGLRALFAGAAVEGGVELCQSIRKKCKEKRLCDFNEDDWLDVMKKTSKGFSKGGIRATSIYLLTNYTATPAAVANAILTASFGMAEQAHFLQSGALNEQEFIENSEMICLEATVSALVILCRTSDHSGASFGCRDWKQCRSDDVSNCKGSFVIKRAKTFKKAFRINSATKKRDGSTV